ncbi:MAG: SRPBCC domain-containing protein [Pirellula sp.]|nr:SRPBCC domain-containing protein [Pirellula sp.]
MENYKFESVFDAPIDRVFGALTTQSGLRAWWTSACDSRSENGDEFVVRFDNTFKVMQITRLVPCSAVQWHVLDSYLDIPDLRKKDEWIGTTICMNLVEESDLRTRFVLEHVGLTSNIECFEICSGGWAHFLASLKEFVETGKGRPFV